MQQLPDGYVRVAAGTRQAVAREWAAPAIRDIIDQQTLHAWAAAQPGAVPMQGRGTNYALPFGSCRETGGPVEVVVRRNRHGGLLRAITGELFRTPSRAPQELAISIRLAAAGVNTPELIAYALYPAVMNLVRCDVVTRKLPPGGDLPDVWRKASASDRTTLLAATARLLHAMARAGARHADLNLKNIYVTGQDTHVTAYILDVDRVTFPGTAEAAARNFSRLARSVRKWRTKWGLEFDEHSLERLAALVMESTDAYES